MSRTCTFHIVDTTLREGEQFAAAHFSSADRMRIARALDQFGVEYIEMTSPVASPQSARDLRTVACSGLRAKILTHVRCVPADIELAAECGVAGVNLLLGASEMLRTHSHRRSLDEILAEATAAVALAHRLGMEVRFSCEDAFRTPIDQLLTIYRTVDALGVHRVGVADTVGLATPRQTAEVVATIRENVRCDIEFHGHNDGGCAVANAYAALESGATHIDTTILGIGERNGIASLSGLIARLYLTNPDWARRYDLTMLPEMDEMVSRMTGVPVPFNACITGATAFTHKAGIHTNAVLRDPRTYEALNPSDFGRKRSVLIGHRLTGRNALGHRAAALGLDLTDDALRQVASVVKTLADSAPLSDAQVDALLTGHSQTKEIASHLTAQGGVA
jgi:homocitrate synthase